MGRKYEAYQKALKAEDMAKQDLAGVSGGATEARYTESDTNVRQAAAVTKDAWSEFIADPEG